LKATSGLLEPIASIPSTVRRSSSSAFPVTDYLHYLPHFVGILFAGTDFDTAVDINAIWQDRLNRLLNVSRIQPSG
jgi:hypothetical protein